MQTSNLHLKGDESSAREALRAWLAGSIPPDFEFISEQTGWTTVLLGGYSLEWIPIEDWLRLASDLIFESFSTSLCSGEIVHVIDGKVGRHLVLDDEGRSEGVDVGSLRYEREHRMITWSDIWTFVEDGHWKTEVER